MKYIKFIVGLLIVITSVLNAENRHAQLLKASSEDVIYYTISSTAKLQRYHVDSKTGKLILMEEFSPNLPGELISTRIFPDGKEYPRVQFDLKGFINGIYFFCDADTQKLFEVRKGSKKVVNRFSIYPAILPSVSKIEGGIILFTNMVYDDHAKNPCRDKYFVKKDSNWKDTGCFGVGPNLMVEFDFPVTAVLDNGKHAVMYKPKAGEFELFDIATEKSIQKFAIEKTPESKTIEGPGKMGIFDSMGKYFLVKHSLDNKISWVFVLDKTQWKSVSSFNESNQSSVILNGFLVYCSKEGNLEVKKID